jgi:hypothetical protein
MGSLPQTQCAKITSCFWRRTIHRTPPELLFKRCTNRQEIATLAQNPYTTQELLLNALDLIARCGLYQCYIEDWECKPLTKQTWINLCPFTQEAYQRHLTSGTITSTHGGYAQNNCFASLATNKDSDSNTEDRNAGTIHSHMVWCTPKCIKN